MFEKYFLRSEPGFGYLLFFKFIYFKLKVGLCFVFN